MKISRRKFLNGFLAVTGLATFSQKVTAKQLTPSASEGPYYPTRSMRHKDIDNNLVKIEGAVKQAGGEVIVLKGKIMTSDGQPRAGHRIEIWQCDVNGNYMHHRDGGSAQHDIGFQGFGHDITDAQGHYLFKTIKPTVYPGRTPHIHVKVLDGNKELLTTQFYLDGDSHNDDDFLFNRMSGKEAQKVLMSFTENNGIEETTVNVTI